MLGPIRHFLFAGFALPYALCATQLQPWFGKDKLFEIRPSYSYQHYDRIDSAGTSLPHSSNDNFFDLSVAISPTPDWSLEAEWGFANTHKNNGFVNEYAFTGRYLLMNDVTALYPVSLAVGTTLSYAPRAAVFDPSTFHQGFSNAEFHVAVGKEQSCGPFWTTHTWGLFGYGVSHCRSPWLHGHLEWERNWWDMYRLAIYTDGLLGLGHQAFPPVIEAFPGYGPLKYRALDLGVRFTYHCVTVGYEARVYARNVPKWAQVLSITFYIPKGI